MDRKFLSLLVLFLSLVPVATAGTAVEFGPIAEVTINAPSVTIYSLTPYDNGAVVAVGSNSSTGSAFHLYVYFLNLSVKHLILETTERGVPLVMTFVMDKELYVIVNSLSPPGILGTGQASVYIFRGLSLVKDYTVNGTLTYMGLSVSQLFNLSALVLMRTAHSPFVPSFNYTIILNGTNITLANKMPLAVLELPQGVFVVVEKSSYSGLVVPPYPVPLNVTLYSYEGKVVWTREYSLGAYSGAVPLSLTSLFALTRLYYATVVGDQLFVINVTAVSTITPSNVVVNAALVGISLNNGSITTRVELTKVTPWIGLMDVGGRLYALIVGQKEVTVEEFNGTALVTVTKVPMVFGVEKGNAGGTVNTGGTRALTTFLYSPGKYLLILNPTPNGTNVTDVYPGGVTSYSLRGNVTDELFADYALLLNESGNSSLAFLNDNGTVRFTMDLGRVAVRVSPSILPQVQGVKVGELDYNDYYVAVERPNSTNATTVVLYQVSFMKTLTFSTMPPITTTPPATSTAPTNLLVPVAVIAIVVVVVVAVLALRRK